jgi:hypothetical protein
MVDFWGWSRFNRNKPNSCERKRLKGRHLWFPKPDDVAQYEAKISAKVEKDRTITSFLPWRG